MKRDRNGASGVSWVLSWAAVVGSGLLALAALANVVFLPATQGLLDQAYAGTAWAPLQAVFDRFATDAYKTPIGLYIQKLDLVYAWAKVLLAFGWLSVAIWTARHRFPTTWRRYIGAFPSGMPLLITAGVALGLADSIRVAAPLAGVLVGGYILFRHGRRGALPLVFYGLSALTATYLTWPWLWLSPVASYSRAIKVMSSYPSHKVLFGGVVYASAEIPWDYVPRLLAIETTEVVIPLFLMGLGLVVWRSIRGKQNEVEPAIWFLWLVTPIFIVVGQRSSLYGNLRQMLFILPPLFLLAGQAIQAVLDRLNRRTWRGAFTLALLAPGIVGIIRLHPYEDSYFNTWVGGTSGAFGRYQVDPWCTSYREAMGYINAHAKQHAVVDVRGPFQSAADFARPDLQMRPDYNPASEPDYELLCQIDLLGEGFQAPLPVVYRITRGKAILAIVKGSP